MAGGTLTVLQSFARRQHEVGAEVTIYYLTRPDSPSEDQMQQRFGPEVDLRNFTTGRRKILDYLALGMAIVEAENSGQFDVIHLHSSKAGALGRLAHLASRRSARIFYSPHGFAFLRQDVPTITRHAFRAAEMVLAKVGDGLVLTCASERSLAKESLKAKRSYLVTTGVNHESVSKVAPPPSDESRARKGEPRPRVGIVARVTYQKAPWRFKKVADDLSHRADFIWIGGAETQAQEAWLGSYQPTGWMAPDELAKALDELDIFLFPTLWEGMPLALIQAQAAGIPAVVSDVVGNRDAVLDGETGFVCASDEGLVERTRQLIEDKELRNKMAAASRKRALKHLTDRQLGKQTLEIYATSETIS
ncbi:glycosyltransferase [Sinomonas albida]|uniref:glycosyltransferase n=1 Tax=Sinomonas albida TaxID=369942 RepID=UPI003019C7EF